MFYVADIQPRIYNLKALFPTTGEMTERLKVHAWKACVRETVPRVRIPLSPPFENDAASRLFSSEQEIKNGFSVRL